MRKRDIYSGDLFSPPLPEGYESDGHVQRVVPPGELNAEQQRDEQGRKAYLKNRRESQRREKEHRLVRLYFKELNSLLEKDTMSIGRVDRVAAHLQTSGATKVLQTVNYTTEADKQDLKDLVQKVANKYGL